MPIEDWELSFRDAVWSKSLNQIAHALQERYVRPFALLGSRDIREVCILRAAYTLKDSYNWPFYGTGEEFAGRPQV